MGLKKSNAHRKKTFLFIVAVLILLVGAWQFYKYKLIRYNLQTAVDTGTRGLYSIHYGQLLVDEVGGNLSVKDLTLFADSQVYNRQLAEGKPPATLFRVSVPEIHIYGVKTPRALIDKEIEGRSVVLTNPDIEIIYTGIKSKTEENVPSRDVYAQLVEKMKFIHLDSVQLVNAKVKTRDFRTGKIRLVASGVSLQLTKIEIDSTHLHDSSQVLFSQSLSLTADSVSLVSQNKLYHVNFEGIAASSANQVLSAKKIRIAPQFPEQDIGKVFSWRKDRIDITLQNIYFSHADIVNLLYNSVFRADSLLVASTTVKVYRDLNVPSNAADRPIYPQQAFARLSVPVEINTLLADKIFIEYKEKNDKSKRSGRLQFFNGHAILHNLVNTEAAIKLNDLCTLNYNGRFLNKAVIHAEIGMHLQGKADRFYVNASLEKILAPDLNPLINPMAMAGMDKGTISSLQFHFTGNDSSCQGKLVMLYDDLKISLLKNKNDVLKKKQFASLAANFIVKNGNPEKNAKPREATPALKRNVTRSFFNTVWKTILAGVKESVGL